MPQISLYIDEATLKKVENAARKNRISISKWVAQQLRARLEAVYPANFSDLFGSISDDSFKRPEQADLTVDAPREEF